MADSGRLGGSGGSKEKLTRSFANEFSISRKHRGVSQCRGAQGNPRQDRRARRTLTSSKNAVQELKFIAKTSEAEVLLTSLSSAVAVGYQIGEGSKNEKKESVPLALAVLYQMETKVVEDTAQTWEILVLGGLLTCIWASLCIGDAQRTSPRALNIEGGFVGNPRCPVAPCHLL